MTGGTLCKGIATARALLSSHSSAGKNSWFDSSRVNLRQPDALLNVADGV